MGKWEMAVNLSVVFWFVLISSCAVSVSALQCFNFSDSFTPNHAYDVNRRALLSSLSSNVPANNDFYTTDQMGQDQNRAYGLGMCIPGSDRQNCSNCIYFASDGLIDRCSNQTEGVAWAGIDTFCMVRYSNRSFFGSLDMVPVIQSLEAEPVIQVTLTDFDNAWEALMRRVIAEATSSSSGSNTIYYGADRQQLGTSRSIYGFVQCSKDISPSNCEQCLRKNLDDYRSCCSGRQRGITERPSCFMRWDLDPFFGLFEDNAAPDPTPPPEKGDRKIPIGVVVGITGVLTFVISMLLSLGVALCIRRKTQTEIADDITTSGSYQFDFREIEAATCNFQKSNKLGHGGFGEVYKGTFQNGTEVAVKRLSTNSGQGEQEFKNEVLLVAKLQHRNLVRLLGFSVEGAERILVYEFVPNKSLNYFLFDPVKRSQLDWRKRYNIIRGITRGMLYLHQDSRLTVVHRDLKASNILLDADMNPKIADFGLARNFRMDQTEANTGRVVGTVGYMPPEYVANGQFSMKSDVYSFGVLILEIIGGKKNSSFHQIDGSLRNLVTYVWRFWNNESLLELLDPAVGENYDKNEVTRCIHIGLLCVQENPADRPTMSTIFQMLTNTSITLHVPQPPGFFFRDGANPLAEGLTIGQSSIMSFACSVDDASITSVNPR
ncbi:PREDICTED: cysteine-rich receptor-like protein kinase 24 isoform X2 [Brassica oleracea var. oleracea]|uniref:cysteine-rich receptor-like protein kinase 24 isoform X2 n=1 Tax=Brassica oleracea var. oleracea TaxID=109376 RepID=UPI0006A74F07|nr:PREDICTED: cysteine-rich receptor-like protein kinase 24 isoform X2 [Brassica oleracea var. oleracea]